MWAPLLHRAVVSCGLKYPIDPVHEKVSWGPVSSKNVILGQLSGNIELVISLWKKSNKSIYRMDR